MGELLNRFWQDDQVQIFAFLIVIDFLLGAIAALKLGTFRLSYVSDFARNDLLFKVLPAFLLYGGLVFAETSDIVIPGLDMGVITRTAMGIAMAALVGSIVNSVLELRLTGQALDVTDAVAGADPNAKVEPSVTPVGAPRP